MEAEYIELSHSMCELFPTRWMVEEVVDSMGLERTKINTISTVWEDNSDVLVWPIALGIRCLQDQSI
eukprot:1831169-Ditylum_brightwellii.AAC.1